MSPVTRDHIDPDAMRALFREQALAVAVVTIGDNPPRGFTATSVTSVSLHPPIISFCVNRDSSTWRALESATHVAMSMLEESQADIARLFATRGVDRFRTARWHSGHNGAPLMDDALAWLECTVIDRVPTGDHVIVLGRPIRAEVNGGNPLVYHQGRYVGVYPLPKSRSSNSRSIINHRGQVGHDS